MESPTPERNTRQAERLQHELLVAYSTMDGFISDWAVNISKGGLFINTNEPLAVGSVVRLMISLPGVAFPFDLKGRVMRTSTSEEGAVSGMGVEFIDLNEATRAQLEQFITQLRGNLDGQPPPSDML